MIVFARRLLLLGSVAYAVWILSVWLRPDMDPFTSYVSELSATDQSWSLLFRASDVVAGLSIAAAVTMVLWQARGRWLSSRHRRRLGWLWPLGWLALGIFGLATVSDALTPMACAVTHDEWCTAREAAGDVPLHHQLHTVTSAVANGALLVAVIALTLLMARRRPVEAVVGWTLVAVIVVGTVWTLVEVAGLHIELPGPSLLGVAQRVQLLAAAAWLGWLALDVDVAAPAPRQP